MSAIVTNYRLRYLDPSRKVICADVIAANTDEEAVEMAGGRRLTRRSELWNGGRLVAKFQRGGVPATTGPSHSAAFLRLEECADENRCRARIVR